MSIAPSQAFSLTDRYTSPAGFVMTHAPFCKKGQVNKKMRTSVSILYYT